MFLCLAPALFGASAAHDRASAPAVSRASDLAGVIDHPCLGRWQGWGRDPWSVEPWSIDLVVTRVEGEACGTIEYPSLRCGGTLETCDAQGKVLNFQEYYTHNPGTCAPAGRIEAWCEGDRMTWRWFGTAEVGTVLHRVR